MNHLENIEQCLIELYSKSKYDVVNLSKKESSLIHSFISLFIRSVYLKRKLWKLLSISVINYYYFRQYECRGAEHKSAYKSQCTTTTIEPNNFRTVAAATVQSNNNNNYLLSKLKFSL